MLGHRKSRSHVRSRCRPFRVPSPQEKKDNEDKHCNRYSCDNLHMIKTRGPWNKKLVSSSITITSIFMHFLAKFLTTSPFLSFPRVSSLAAPFINLLLQPLLGLLRSSCPLTSSALVVRRLSFSSRQGHGRRCRSQRIARHPHHGRGWRPRTERSTRESTVGARRKFRYMGGRVGVCVVSGGRKRRDGSAGAALVGAKKEKASGGGSGGSDAFDKWRQRCL